MRPTYCPHLARFISLLMSAALIVSMLLVVPRVSARSPRKTKSTTQAINPQVNSQRQRQPATRDAGRRVDPIQPERGANRHLATAERRQRLNLKRDAAASL